MRRPPADEHEMMQAASRRIAVQTTMLFAGALILLGLIGTLFVINDEHRQGDQKLRQAVADVDAVSDPRSNVLVFQQTRDGRITSSPGLEGQPISQSDFDSVRAGGRPGTHEIHFKGHEYLVRTDRRGATTVQVAMDLFDQHRERDRLVAALAITGGLGLALAGLLGWLVARRAIAPLGLALERQQRFIADASHELRTPLTQVHTRAQLIAQQAHRMPHADALADDADRLVAGTRQLGEVIDELLMAAQLRAEPSATERVDLNLIAAEVADADRERVQEAGIVIHVNAAERPATVLGVATALRRVLASLLDNAIGHTNPGGTITVDIDIVGPHVQLKVTDTGVGLADVDPETLFERFARGSHGSRRRYGIGLALVREVVSAHGGVIRAGSSESEGAAFTIQLPAAQLPAPSTE